MRILLAHYFLSKQEPVDINSISKFSLSDMRHDVFEKVNGNPIQSLTEAEWLKLRPKAIREIALSKPNLHFVKTHCALTVLNKTPLIPPEYTAGAIYIVRNPFDVALSYARHLSESVDVAIDRMTSLAHTNGSKFGVREPIGRWDSHADQWTNADGLARVMLRYEDLLEDTFGSTTRLLSFFGQKTDVGKLRWAIRKASFKELKRQEEEAGFRERPSTMQKFFVSGTSGGWKDRLSHSQIARLLEEFRPTLERIYPEILSDADAILKEAET